MRHKQQRLLDQNIKHLGTYIKEHELKISPEEMILSITEADPDWQNLKNSKWLIKNLLNKSFLWEDIEAGKQSKAYDTLSRFVNIRKQWSESSLKDIQAYKGLSGIASAIRPFEITKSMGEIKREERAKIYSETIVLYDKDDYLVVIPKTEEASCFWGRNTEWCTASTKSENYFEHYNPKGPLIIAITPEGRKYQFHNTCVPMDENDQEIDNITDPVLVELALLTGQIASIKDIDYTNPRHCRLAVQQDGYAIEYIDKNLPEYHELCKLAVQQNGWIIRHIDKDLPEYHGLCKLAVQQNEYAIQYINKNISEYPELCKLAVQQDGGSIQYIDKNLPEYPELCKLAVQQDGYAIEYIDKNLPGYSELCKLAVQQDGYAIEYIDKNLPGYVELCKLAVQQNGYAIKYVDEFFIEYMEFLELASINESPKTENIIPKWLTNKDYEEIITNLENLDIPKIEKSL